jgi:hypothetical protein
MPVEKMPARASICSFGYTSDFPSPTESSDMFVASRRDAPVICANCGKRTERKSRQQRYRSTECKIEARGYRGSGHLEKTHQRPKTGKSFRTPPINKRFQ